MRIYLYNTDQEATMKKTIVLIALCLFAALFLLASCGGSSGGETEPATEARPVTDAATVPETEGATEPATDAATIPVTEPATDPVTEPVTDPVTVIPEHDHEWDEGRVIKEGTCDPSTKKETKGEIMFTCTICGATRTEETDGHKWDESKDKVLTAATCVENGKLLRTCANCEKKVQFVIPATGIHKPEGALRIVTPPTESSAGVTEQICKYCGAPVTAEYTDYAAYRTQANAIRKQLSGFSASDFGGSDIQTDLGNDYAKPPVNPTTGQHPRVMFNAADLDGIRNALVNGMNVAAATEFRAQVALMETGVLSAAYDHGGDNGVHNFNGRVLSNIMALALDYQLTGNEITGYQAILAAKNYLKTIDVQSFKPDPERTMGNIMYAMACVYDWCYPLMTRNDRNQIVAGVQHKCCESTFMSKANREIGFPPSGLNPVSGHGSEFQLLRDYMSFSIAIYDEYPGWWEFVGGRFYEQYVPVRNEYYAGGMVPQGISQYVQIRFAADCYSALLIKAMSGSIPYDEEGMHRVIRTIHSYALPNEFTFASGDGSNTTTINQPKKAMEFGMASMISSHLFGDATVRALFEAGEYSYSTFGDGQYGLEQTVGYACEELICSSGGVAAAKNLHEGMDLVVYNGGWLGQMIARNNWTVNQAAVLMKIGVRADSNHGHQDAGQFQIWYKGMLAGDTGAYASYNTDHWKYYHQATIAHNSLLINNGGGGTYYCGGQLSHTAEPSGLTAWKNGDYETGVVTGYDCAYADEEKTKLVYAYIAGDIAKAYGSSTASEVTRRMLAVYDTDNRDVPMFFFVFDNITAASADYQKTFLLHTVSDPVINGKTVTVTATDGKLVLQNIVGGDSITSIGGSGKNYQVNGKQITPNRYELDGYWGRVEIKPNTGKATDQILNVMYVCDKNKEPDLTATKISGSTLVQGAVIGNTAAVFVVKSERRATSLVFTVPGEGDLHYYVSGVKAGNWTVKAGGTTLTVTATEEGGILSFTAPAGSVSLTPQ